jgi:glyoxalase family protein
MSTPYTAGFHHVAMTTGDAARSVAFYQDVLGLTLHARVEDDGDGGEDGGERLVFGDPSARPGTLLVLVERPGAAPGRPGIGGVHHTALGVADEDGLLMWKRRLTDLGLAVSGPYDRGYFTSLYFRDPDGQILELATAGPGYAIDEPVDRLGGELKVPPDRIVRGHRDEAAIAALTHPDPVPDIAPAMTLQGIHHVSGITDDLDVAGRFYQEVFGLDLVKRTTNRDDPRQLHYFWAVRHGQELAPHSAYTLFGWPSGWNRTRPGRGQTLHVAFRAGPASTLDAWAARLDERGVDTRAIDTGPDSPGLAFDAPDGQALRLVADGGSA